MFKLKFLSFLLTVALQGTAMASEVDKYIGGVIPIAMFPELKNVPSSCQWYTLEKVNDNVKCTCGDKTDLPLYAIKHAAAELKQEFVPIVVDTSSEITAAVGIQGCTCGDKNPPRFVFKPINDNYFVQYEVPYNQSDDSAPNTAILFLKNTPKKSEMERLIKSINDLANRNYGLLCDTMFFAKEN